MIRSSVLRASHGRQAFNPYVRLGHDETSREGARKVPFERSPEIQASDGEFPFFGAPAALCDGPQSYKLDNLVFTNVKSSMANDRHPGIYCDKGRPMMAQKNPHAGLSDLWRRYTHRPD